MAAPISALVLRSSQLIKLEPGLTGCSTSLRLELASRPSGAGGRASVVDAAAPDAAGLDAAVLDPGSGYCGAGRCGAGFSLGRRLDAGSAGSPAITSSRLARNSSARRLAALASRRVPTAGERAAGGAVGLVADQRRSALGRGQRRITRSAVAMYLASPRRSGRSSSTDDGLLPAGHAVNCPE